MLGISCEDIRRLQSGDLDFDACMDDRMTELERARTNIDHIKTICRALRDDADSLSETQFPSIHDKTDIYTADGRHVAHIERKLMTLHEVRYIDMADGSQFALSNELFHLIRDVTNIEGLGWVMEGNFMQLNFTIRDEAGKLIALAHQKMFSVHDKYSVDIYMQEHEDKVVTILVALQHMIRDRQNAAANSGGGAS